MLKNTLKALTDGNISADLTQLTNIVGIIKNVATTIFGLLTVAAIFLAIFLAYKFFTAEDDGKRKNAKQQLIYAIIGVIVLIVLTILAPTIVGFAKNALTK